MWKKCCDECHPWKMEELHRGGGMEKPITIDSVDAVKEFIAERISLIGRTPEVMGSMETVEFELLTLVELDLLMRGRDSKSTLRKWQEFLLEEYPGNGPIYLNTIMKKEKAKDGYKKIVNKVFEFWRKVRE